MRADNAIENHLEDAFAKTCCRNAQGCKLSADIGQIETAQSIVYRNGHNRSIVDVEGSLFDALLQDAAQNAQFSHIKTSPRMFKLDDIAKEFGLKRAITDHRVAHLVKTAEDVAFQLLVSWNLKWGDFLDSLNDVAHLAIDDRQKDFRLRLEIRVQCTSTLLRLCGDLVHRRIVEALGGKQLAGHFDKF